jgi:arginase
MAMRLDIIGAPSSAGAYTPGQERAPESIRAAGLVRKIEDRGIAVRDRGDVRGFRWRVDRENPRAMNAEVAAAVARELADRVAESFAEGAAVLVLGGDCTVEIGTVAGATSGAAEVGLVYIDLDTDLNTPGSVDDGALDWMGVAHMLGLEGTVSVLAAVGEKSPLLRSDQVLLFANSNSTPFERGVIESLRIAEVPLAKVVADPSGSARGAVETWARRFDRLLVHVDADVLDYVDFAIAENARRNQGLTWSQLTAALRELIAAPNWAALTICEVNPQHADEEGSSLCALAETLADVLAGARTATAG